MAEFHEPRLSRNLAVTAALAEVARLHGISTPAAAVAWTLAWPGVTGAIVGARRPHQVEDWLVAETVVLTKSDFDTVAHAIEGERPAQGPPGPKNLLISLSYDRATFWECAGISLGLP